MPAYLYKIEDSKYYQLKNVQLSGYGIIQKIFEAKEIINRLTEKTSGIGWEISKEELQQQIHLDEGDGEYEVVFEVEPKKIKTNLKQLQHIYLFSHNYYEGGTVYWTVMMLKLKTILFREVKKLKIKSFIAEPEIEEVAEFLYLQKSWNYGMVGRMNAAMIESEARDFFKKFF